MNSFKLAEKKNPTSCIILYRMALQKHYGSLLGEKLDTSSATIMKENAVAGFVCNNGRCHFKSSSLDSIENHGHRSRDSLRCLLSVFLSFNGISLFLCKSINSSFLHTLPLSHPEMENTHHTKKGDWVAAEEEEEQGMLTSCGISISL